MNVYEFCTPSDPITFKAMDDRIACFVGVQLGSGKAGVSRVGADEVKIPSMLMFEPKAKEIFENFLGVPAAEFMVKNAKAIGESLLSFAYGSPSDRAQFDDACAAITDPERLAEFKSKHEERQRTSMSKWVSYAWGMGEAILKKAAEGIYA